MSIHRCPGQSPATWGADHIFEVECKGCGEAVELFKDDVFRACPKCARRVINPKLDLGCMEWCKFADECAAELKQNPEALNEKKRHQD